MIHLLLAAAAAAGTPQAESQQYVVWSPRGLPPRVGRVLRSVDGVDGATGASFSIDWLHAHGATYPLEVLAVRPRAFARYAPAEDRRAIRSLRRGEALIPRSEARLRGGVPRDLRLRSGRVRVAGVISDRAAQGYEAIVAARPPWRYALRIYLVRGEPGLKRRIRAAVEQRPRGVRSAEEVRFLRYAPTVPPQLYFKRSFGEFAARPVSAGTLPLRGGWLRRSIRTAAVPILGRVTCHDRLFPQLRGALGELRRRGLSGLVRRGEYAGCFNPRFVATPRGVRLSRHSWGVALDINTRGNGFGQKPHQDPRLVETFERWGFQWGGRWLLRDGMHFEWERFPGG